MRNILIRIVTVLPFAVVLSTLTIIATCSYIKQAANASPVLSQATATAATTKVTISEKDDGKTITVTEGSDVSIELNGNITTGYSWKVTTVSGKSAQQDGKVTYKDGPGKGVGRPGMFFAKFTTATVGDTTVNMEYKRPWEKNTPALKTFSVTIRVVPKKP